MSDNVPSDMELEDHSGSGGTTSETAATSAAVRPLSEVRSKLRAELGEQQYAALVHEFLRENNAVAQAGRQLGETSLVPRQVTPKDVRLEEFSGATRADAQCIERDQFLPLLQWLDTCEFTLRCSGLPGSHHVNVLLQHLAGPAKQEFMKMYATADTSQWSFAEAKGKIASLVPDSRVQFTRMALNMSFRAASLPDDIREFIQYLSHGDASWAASEFLASELRLKVSKAVPRFYEMAFGFLGVSIDQKNFGDAAAKTLSTAQSLAARNLLERDGGQSKKRDSAVVPVSKIKKQSKVLKKPRAVRIEEAKAAAKRLGGRCDRCGMLVKVGDNHQCKPSRDGVPVEDDLLRRVGAALAAERAGKDPNVLRK